MGEYLTHNIGELQKKLLIKNCIISFYGASVTQQGMGYVHGFSKIMKEYIINQYGIGSVSLKEATFLLDKIILNKENKSDICFLEWFTAGWNIQMEDLNYLVIKLLSNNILPVFLLMYNNNDRDEREKTKLLYYKISDKMNIPLIDLDTYTVRGKYYSDNLFRDYTHLTEEGGTFYGKKLSDIINDINIYKSPENNLIFIPYKSLGGITKPSGNSNIPELAHCINEGENVFLPCMNAKLLAIWTVVGPDSGIIKIIDDELKIEKISLWDEWCHYDRFMIRKLSKEREMSKNIKISLTNENPEYSRCRRKVSTIQDKKLWLIGWTVEIT